jgi:hypothetical protein
VLWVKLNVEDPLVDEWVVVENNYTHQGEYKGYHLKGLLRDDPRFAPFLPKLHVIESDIRPDYRPGEEKVQDHKTIRVERAQREAAVGHLLSNYDDPDYVLISDVDECLDLEAPKRRRLLRRKLASGHDVILVPRIRYWFDYNNRWLSRRCKPIVSIGRLRRDGALEIYLDPYHLGTPVIWKHEMIFEYSHCFPREKISRKFETFMHTGFEQHEIDAALRCNHRPTSELRSRRLDWTYKDWFVQRRLTRRNSPAFVRRHFATLRTNAVSTDYRRHRVEEYPQFFPRRRVSRFLRWTSLYARLCVDLIDQNPGSVTSRTGRLKARVRRRLGAR